ncbi:hypothetical protein [Mycoplasmopsis verecunda]|uniref:Uncharacterized protein n=1 Tax=Mycoplasmopsis verecunda TaxID=171291 RepID=A0A1T4M3P3_9BACT|nr:hypothetical protein [Mycoplasmopsis verecunda]WPB54725.1 hypothetical protein SAM46_01035 [Mycoplasmopsis verecunda]SJZ61610.1 hypothetical protein SAMN02745154_00616 [Mycoplasmopsis verecunda]
MLNKEIGKNLLKCQYADFYFKLLQIDKNAKYAYKFADSYYINIFINLYLKNINSMIKHILDFKWYSNATRDEIQNIFINEYSKLISGKNEWFDSEMKELYFNYGYETCVKYLWKTLKINTQNQIQKFCTEQQKFENRIANRTTNLKTLSMNIKSAECAKTKMQKDYIEEIKVLKKAKYLDASQEYELVKKLYIENNDVNINVLDEIKKNESTMKYIKRQQKYWTEIKNNMTAKKIK